MSVRQIARRWAQNNPQLATTLLSLAVVAGFAAASGDLANLDGVDTMGGTASQSGP